MGASRRVGLVALGLALLFATTLSANVVMRGISLDRPLVLDENKDYELRDVSVTGLMDCAALTLTGRISSVLLERCRFSTSDSFLKQLYANNPWRMTPPVAEFYNIDRLELLDNEYSNMVLIIHPSVKQVVVRGSLPGLKLTNPQATQIIQLNPGQLASSVPLLRPSA